MVAGSKAAVNTVQEASVLRELKETILRQDKEIESLKNELSRSKGSKGGVAAPSHGHGGGADASKEEIISYLTEPFYRIASKRVGWLGLFLVSLSMTALIMNGFEHTLERQIELAYFVPLLAGHGGNVGGQAVGTVLSAISAGVVAVKDAPRVIGKEALSGLMVGTFLGMFVGCVAHFVMGISAHVAAVVVCTLPLVSTIAATLGSTIPFACVAMGLDPKVIAAPAMTSFVDVSGLMSYFLIANQVFALFGVKL
ncbi:hypothetical protein ACA910_005270 [Epithemia clementina (nom. ined.)]